MKILVVILTYFLFSSAQVFAQTPWKVWDAEFTFGGNLDNLLNVIDDGEGYITGGYYCRYIPPPPQSIYKHYPALARFSRNGSLLWKLVDSSHGEDMIAVNGILKIPGESSFLMGTAYWIQKRDFAGQKIWERNWEDGDGATLAAGNDFFVASTMVGNPIRFLKFSANGDSLDGWELEPYAFATVYGTAIRSDTHYLFGTGWGGSNLNLHGKILVQSITTKETLWTRVIDNVGRMFGTVDDSGG